VIPLANLHSTLRIIVADDWPDTAESLQMLLEIWGYEVLVAYSGTEVLNSVRSFRPDVILLDFSMPGLNGGETAKRLRQLPGFERLFLLAATSYNDDEELFKPYRHLFDRHLLKPFSLTILEELLAICAAAKAGN
jgi:CheY-like chemotaxis protein